MALRSVLSCDDKSNWKSGLPYGYRTTESFKMRYQAKLSITNFGKIRHEVLTLSAILLSTAIILIINIAY